MAFDLGGRGQDLKRLSNADIDLKGERIVLTEAQSRAALLFGAARERAVETHKEPSGLPPTVPEVEKLIISAR